MMLTRALVSFAFMAIASMASVDKQTYVIHMDQAKLMEKTKITALDNQAPYQRIKNWYETILDSISEVSKQGEDDKDHELSNPQLLYVYQTAISGFAAKLSTRQLAALKKVDGFLSAFPDEMLSLHTTHSPQFLGLELSTGLWARQSMGSDVIIGVADTGIWPEHVSFQDTGLSPIPARWKGTCQTGTNFSPSNCNHKLIGAKAYFQGYESVAGSINEKSDYRSPRDAQGHGTHTASTAAGNLVSAASFYGLANGSAAGMRFSSRIAVYKVCWEFGCASSDILAAIDEAIVDGVDVLSLSLGGSSKPYDSDPIAIAAFRATQKGIFVSCSAGNSGPEKSSVSNIAPWIMTVAASYTDRSFPTIVKLGNGETLEGSSLYTGKSKSTRELPLVFNKTAGFDDTETPFCFPGSLNKKLARRKMVVCLRGGNGRTQKGEQVRLAGGAGMLLVNTENQGEELFADPHILPATSLGASAGETIRNYLKSAKNPTASITFKGTSFNNPAPMVTAFSSRGPSSDGPDVIKPDVTAPGMNILAAWPPKTSPSLLKTDKRSVLFNIISGTSMSCPHVSGLAALLKSIHPNWSPAAIKSALMTTAYTLNNKNLPIADISLTSSDSAATPFALGSGHVDPEKASDPGLIYDITPQDYLIYLCSLHYNSTQIGNMLGYSTSFTCPKPASNLHPGDLNYPSFAVNFQLGASNSTITFKRTLTNVGGAPSVYKVQVNSPSGVMVKVEPNILRFNKLGDEMSYRVTFTGLGKKAGSVNPSFGDLIWAFGKYSVRSPIAVTWQ